MKKFLALLLAVLFAVSVAACGNGAESSKKIEGTLEEVMQQIIDTVDVDAEVKEYVLGGLMQMPVDKEGEAYYLGKEGFNYVEALAAEPMITAQAFSLVLIRTENTEESAKISEEIVKVVDPRKWLWVGVEEDQVKSAYVNDLVILIMAENADKYIEAFNALAK